MSAKHNMESNEEERRKISPEFTSEMRATANKNLQLFVRGSAIIRFYEKEPDFLGAQETARDVVKALCYLMKQSLKVELHPGYSAVEETMGDHLAQGTVSGLEQFWTILRDHAFEVVRRRGEDTEVVLDLPVMKIGRCTLTWRTHMEHDADEFIIHFVCRDGLVELQLEWSVTSYPFSPVRRLIDAAIQHCDAEVMPDQRIRLLLSGQVCMEYARNIQHVVSQLGVLAPNVRSWKEQELNLEGLRALLRGGGFSHDVPVEVVFGRGENEGEEKEKMRILIQEGLVRIQQCEQAKEAAA